MLLTVACSLAAQSDEGGKQDFVKDLTRQKFHLRAGTRLPTTIIRSVSPEQEKTCSIPLLQVQPPSKHGTMVIIEPKQAHSNMPKVQVPAPPCKDWPTE